MTERFKIVWTRAATVDLDQLIDHVAMDSGADRALGLYEKIRDKIESIALLPRRGRIVPELERITVSEFRELLMGRYRIVYRINGRKIVLIGILDGRRDLEAILVDRAFAGHKGPLGPQGIGGLWAAPHVTFESPNATCDVRSRAAGKACAPMPGYCDLGSVNMAAAAGLAAGIRWLKTDGSSDPGERPRRMASELAAALRRRAFCTVYGGRDAERTATVSTNVEGLTPEVVEARFRKQGIYVRGGQHCAPMALAAIGAPEGTVRISFSPLNHDRDVERIVSALDSLVRS